VERLSRLRQGSGVGKRQSSSFDPNETTPYPAPRCPPPKSRSAASPPPPALDAAAIAARAEYAGLVVFPPSPRHLALADAAALGARAAGRIKLVGLFVDAADALIAGTVTAARLDVIQLPRQGRPRSRRRAPCRLRPAGAEGPLRLQPRRHRTRRNLCGRGQTWCCSTPSRQRVPCSPAGLAWCSIGSLLAGHPQRGAVGPCGRPCPRQCRRSGARHQSAAGRCLFPASKFCFRGVKDMDLIAAFCREARAA